MAITVAEKVLIAGGVLNLAYGVLLGYPITVIRAKGAPAVPKYLLAAHVGALLRAAVLLGLAWAARLSALGPGWRDVAAWLLVAASALIAALGCSLTRSPSDRYLLRINRRRTHRKIDVRQPQPAGWLR